MKFRFTVYVIMVVMLSLSCKLESPDGKPPPGDTIAPHIVAVNPADDSVDVSVTSSIYITFSEQMDADSVQGAFSLSDGSGGIGGSFTLSDDTMLFEADANLAYCTTYYISLTTSASDTAGNPIANEFNSKFTSMEAPDTTPPAISAVIPGDLAIDVPITATVSITFSEQMDITSAQGAFSLLDGIAAIIGSFGWSGDTMTFHPSSNLSYSRAYSVKVTTSAKDTSGNPMLGEFNSTFSTVADTTPPRVTQVGPSDNSDSVPVTANVWLSFSETMDKASAQGAFSLSDGVALVAGSFSWLGDSMTFDPSNDLSIGKTYYVKLTTAAKDTSGNPLAGEFHSSFITDREKWRFLTGDMVSSSPAIGSDGTIYVGSYDDKLYAINTNGSKKWEYPAGSNVLSPSIGSDGTIYVASQTNSTLHAINPDGSSKWKFVDSTSWYVWTTPAIAADGTIYFQGGGKLFALNPDGSEKWEFSPAGAVLSAPAIGPDGTVYVSAHGNRIVAIHADGSQKWEFYRPNHGSDTGGFYALAIGSDGTIYAANGNGKVYAVNGDGTMKWEFATAERWEGSSAAVGSDGTIYVSGVHSSSYDNSFYAINPDGTGKWAYAAGVCAQQYGVVSSPAIGADGTLYVGSQEYHLYAMNPDGTKKWAFATGGVVCSSPAIGDDGTIYFGAGSILYAVQSDSLGLSDSPWPKHMQNNSNTGRKE